MLSSSAGCTTGDTVLSYTSGRDLQKDANLFIAYAGLKKEQVIPFQRISMDC